MRRVMQVLHGVASVKGLSEDFKKKRVKVAVCVQRNLG